MTGDELGRRARPLLDRPPYAPLAMEELRARAQHRRRRSQRAVAGLAVAVLLAAGVATFGATRGSSGPGVRIRTTTPPTASSTVPASTTISDLQFTSMAGPDGTAMVELFAAGDRFLAVPDAADVTRLWSGDARGHWASVPVPSGLLHQQLQSVAHVGSQYYVLARNRSGVIIFVGPDFARLHASSWKVADADLARSMHPAPPRGRGLLTGATVESIALSDSGVVVVGEVAAGFDPRLLPSSIREQLAHRPGRVDVVNGRVRVTVAPHAKPVFDRSAHALGLSVAVVHYLELPDASRTQTTFWGAAFGAPIRQLPRSARVGSARLFNPSLLPVGGGLLLAADTASASNLWWTREGTVWRRLAPPPGEVQTVVDLGDRWVMPFTGVESADEGRSWVPIDIGPLPSHANAPPGFGASGTPGFGILGAATPINASTVTTYATRLYYSPDGVHWSSVVLNDALHFDSNIPMIAVGSNSAIVESGRHALGAQPQRFWLVTVR